MPSRTTIEQAESPLKFPCQYPIKVLGYWAEDFDALVLQIIRRHVHDIGEGSVRSRESRGGRYVSVTVTIEARSRDQLDAIYRDLTSERRVVMAL
ncbi:MAG: HP0495 family protein [Chromatiales bacterium]